MASTSGTINSTQIDVITCIERAVRRCGRLPGSLSSEDLDVARQNLFLSMTNMLNRGIPLWSIEKIILGVNLNQITLPLPIGTIDLRNVLYRYNVLPSGGTAFSSAGGNASNAFDRNLSTACTQTAPNGYISYNFGQSVLIPTVGFLNNQTETLSPVYEYSNDNIAWTQIAQGSNAGGQACTSGAKTYEAGQWYWQDIAQPVSAQFFRIRETGGGTLNITELVFGQPAYETTIARTNADDYQNLPNKNIVAGNQRVLQYWLDRQITPQLWLWPPAGFAFNSLVVWGRRQLQDVGSLTDILEFPDRWLDSTIWTLAEALSHELQGVDVRRIPLIAQKSQQAAQLAWGEERDASPVYYAPNISVYTRGH